MNNQSPSRVLGHLANIASLNPFSPFTMGLNDVLDMIKTDELSVSTGDKPVTKDEVKKAMENSDAITMDSKIENMFKESKYPNRGESLPEFVQHQSFKKRSVNEILRYKPSMVANSGGLVKQILQRSKSNITILNALSYLGYNYSELKKHMRWRKMSLSEFLGTLSKPQLIEIYNYVDSHMASRGPK